MIFLFPFPLRQWYLTGVEIFYILISALFLGMHWEKKQVKLLVIIFGILIIYAGALKIQTLYVNVTDFGGVAKNKGKLQAIDYIYKDAKTKNFGLLIFSPPVYTYNYDYLLWWYGKNKYGYVPTAEKKQTFYLLIEPDPVKPWSYKGWIATVIKDGKVLKTVTRSSGFIIQKRIME